MRGNLARMSHPSVQDLQQALHAKRDQVVDELLELIRIPSVSTDPTKRAQVHDAATFVADALNRAGLRAQVHATPGHPVVTAESAHVPGAPTVLIYGHYDVQPAEPLELWTTPPFEPQIRDGKIFARGASDDKGQVYAHIKAVELLQALDGRLPLNVRFVVEGEEEIGSPNLANFLRAHKEILKADVALISDGAMLAPGVPSLTYGLRGLAYVTVKVRSAGRDLHSGGYGGGAPNATFALVQMLASLKGRDGRIQIDGFYDDVAPLSTEERARFASVPFEVDDFMRDAGITSTPGEEGFTLLERLWARPTLDTHGLGGGFVGAGSKTVIPAEAMAKVSCRLVPNQDPHKVVAQLRAHLEKVAPAGVQVEVTAEGLGEPAITPLDHPAVAAVSGALTAVWGREPVFTRGGGSIPVVVDLQRQLGAVPILLDMGLPDDGAHAPNEKFDIDNYLRGIVAAAAALRALAA